MHIKLSKVTRGFHLYDVQKCTCVPPETAQPVVSSVHFLQRLSIVQYVAACMHLVNGLIVTLCLFITSYS